MSTPPRPESVPVPPQRSRVATYARACLLGVACAIGVWAPWAAVRSLTAQTPAPGKERVEVPAVVSAPAAAPAQAVDLPAAPPADVQPAPALVPFVMAPDGRKLFLGRQRPTRRPKIWLHDYLRRAPTAAVPTSVDYYTKAMPAISQVYGNDYAGCCVISSGMHQEAVFAAHGLGTSAVGSSAEALATYHEFCGPGDNGCNIMAVLDRRKAGGIKVGGKAYKILDYVGVDWRQQQLLETAIYLFGAVEFGVNLPRAWESAPTWDVVSSPIVGGHDIPGFGFDPAGITISTWGGTRKLTWRAATSTRYVEEAYVILSENWSKNPDLAKLGIDVAALQADLALLEQGKSPTIPPTPPPAPVPVPDPLPPAPGPGPSPGPQPVPTPPATVTSGPLPALAITHVIPDTAIPSGFPAVAFELSDGSLWQCGSDGSWWTSKDFVALRNWVMKHDHPSLKAGEMPHPTAGVGPGPKPAPPYAQPGQPASPPPQAPPVYTVTGTISINGGPALPLAIGNGPVPSAQAAPR